MESIIELKAKMLTLGIAPGTIKNPLPDKYKFETKVVVSDRHFTNKERKILPSELILEHNGKATIVKTIFKETSPLVLHLDGEKVYVDGYEDVKVRLVKRNPADLTSPPFVGHVGVDKLSVVPFVGCFYWLEGVNCRFCGASPNPEWKKHELSIFTKNLYKVWKERKEEFLEMFEKHVQNFLRYWEGPHLHFMVMGNWVENQDAQFEIGLDVLSYFSDIAKKSDSYFIMLPPKSLGLIDKAYETGVKYIQFNIEVWGEEYFKEAVPGKHKYYSFDFYVKALKYAVDVFGEGNVRTNFVLGIQPFSKTKEGMEKLADIGVIPSYTVFHPRPKSAWRDRKPPFWEDVLEFARWHGDLLRSYGYKPYACPLSSRSSLENEAVRGWV